MTRGRKPPDIESSRELVETDLAELGNARVLLRLVFERVQLVSEFNQVLFPALEDLQRVDRSIKRVQARIAARADE